MARRALAGSMGRNNSQGSVEVEGYGNDKGCSCDGGWLYQLPALFVEDWSFLPRPHKSTKNKKQ
jgi:hypothetical protein